MSRASLRQRRKGFSVCCGCGLVLREPEMWQGEGFSGLQAAAGGGSVGQITVMSEVSVGGMM